MASIHFICRDRAGIRAVDAKSGIYDSSAWLLSDEDASALKDGNIYFHQTKDSASYFGGTVLSIRPIEHDLPDEGGRRRWIITLESRRDCKDVDWNEDGHTHGMAWTSGLITS